MKSTISAIITLFLFSQIGSAQTIDQQFFSDANNFFQGSVKQGLVDYSALKDNAQLKALIQAVEIADLTDAAELQKKAFYINAYNIQVINQAVQAYPLNSVQSVNGFFDTKKVKVAGESLTLNQLEKDLLLKPYGDARFHFVLVCGALGCPPITSFAYMPEKLDQQLDQQTRASINNPDFIRTTGSSVALSQIFKWYAGDFGNNKQGVVDFINNYREQPIPPTAKVTYYDYDWTLNDFQATSSNGSSDNQIGNNTSRYIVSSTIQKGSVEVKIFNNLYSQKTGGEDNLTDRSTFLTTSVSFLYGLSNRFNIGFNTRYRRVRNNGLPSSPFSVFSSGETGTSRQGLTAFGPQIRFAPVPKWENFSIQSSFVFPIGDDLSGRETSPFIDWAGPTWNTQIFNDFPVGNNFSLFTEIDFLIEDIGSSSDGRINRFSTPATLIFSYNPNRKITLYTLGGYSPYWQSDFDYFVQAGIGAKYQFTPNLELELLLTDFSNKFLSNSGGQAATYNIGFRFNL